MNGYIGGNTELTGAKNSKTASCCHTLTKCDNRNYMAQLAWINRLTGELNRNSECVGGL